ncbi:hypothetical protein ACOMHN_027835 [Nucella lapillus]
MELNPRLKVSPVHHVKHCMVAADSKITLLSLPDCPRYLRSPDNTRGRQTATCPVSEVRDKKMSFPQEPLDPVLITHAHLQEMERRFRGRGERGKPTQEEGDYPVSGIDLV